MNEAAAYIGSLLTANAALQTLVSGAHYWELAPAKQALPFITFRIIENIPASKDRLGDYDVSFFCYHSSMTVAGNISAALKVAMADFKYRGGTSGYADTEGREGFIQLNFNFKIRY